MLACIMMIIVICILCRILYLKLCRRFIKCNKSNYLAVQTVTRFQENHEYLLEWITFHKLIGFKYFFIYDNSESDGSSMWTRQLKPTERSNKYGFVFLKDYKYIYNKLKQIDGVYIIKWSPVKKNKVVYNQSQATEHYIRHYSHLSKWTAFIDVDEFIVHDANHDIRDYINYCEDHNISNIKIHQRKFEDRFISNAPVRKITTAYDFEKNGKLLKQITDAPKNISQNCMLWSKQLLFPHVVVTFPGGTINFTSLYFHHYNMNNRTKKNHKKYKINKTYDDNINKLFNKFQTNE